MIPALRLTALLLAPTIVAAQSDPVAASRAHYREAVRAYEARDYTGFLEHAAVPIERGHPRYREPTLGALVGRELYYVANSQWELFGEDGRIAEPDSLQQPVVLRLRL